MHLDFSLSFTTRISLTLPPWFGDDYPNLTATIAGFSAGHKTQSDQIAALVPYTRITTTTGELLDLAAYDFLGAAVQRGVGELDNAFRARWLSKLFRPTGTRPAFIQEVLAATGNVPIIFAPRYPLDTGVLGSGDLTAIPTLFYSAGNGGYTNYNLQYQWFVRITNTSQLYTNNKLYAYVAEIMPAGTVCWLNIAGGGV